MPSPPAVPVWAAATADVPSRSYCPRKTRSGSNQRMNFKPALMGGVAERTKTAWKVVLSAEPSFHAVRPATLEPAGVEPVGLKPHRRHLGDHFQLILLGGLVSAIKDEPRVLRHRRHDQFAVNARDVMGKQQPPQEVVSPQTVGSLPPHQQDSRRADRFAGQKAEMRPLLTRCNRKLTLAGACDAQSPLARPADRADHPAVRHWRLKYGSAVCESLPLAGSDTSWPGCKAASMVSVVVGGHRAPLRHDGRRPLRFRPSRRSGPGAGCFSMIGVGLVRGVLQPQQPFDGRKVGEDRRLAGNLQAGLLVRPRDVSLPTVSGRFTGRASFRSAQQFRSRLAAVGERERDCVAKGLGRQRRPTGERFSTTHVRPTGARQHALRDRRCPRRRCGSAPTKDVVSIAVNATRQSPAGRHLPTAYATIVLGIVHMRQSLLGKLAPPSTNNDTPVM